MKVDRCHKRSLRMRSRGTEPRTLLCSSTRHSCSRLALSMYCCCCSGVRDIRGQASARKLPFFQWKVRGHGCSCRSQRLGDRHPSLAVDVPCTNATAADSGDGGVTPCPAAAQCTVYMSREFRELPTLPVISLPSDFRVRDLPRAVLTSLAASTSASSGRKFQIF